MEKILRDRDELLEALRHDCAAFRFATDELKRNVEVIVEAFKITPSIWIDLDEDIKNDKNILLKAINGLDVNLRKSESALNVVPEELKNDKDIIFALLEKGTACHKYFEQLDDSVKNDRDFLLEAVKRNGFTICFFSKEFFKDREIVCEALKDLKLKFGVSTILYELEDIKPEFFADKELMTLVARNYASIAVEYATDEVKEDRNFRLAVVENCMIDLRQELPEELPEEFRSDKELLQRVMQKLSCYMGKAMTIPESIREHMIKGWRVLVNSVLQYEGIQEEFSYEILNIIKYFDSELLEEYKEILAEYADESFLSADDIRKCAEEKGEGTDTAIESIASIMQQRQEEERLRIEAEIERAQAEYKARQAKEKKEEIQEPRAEADERTAEIQKALAGLEALNLSAEEIDKLTAQLSQLKAVQTQRNMGEADVGKGE